MADQHTPAEAAQISMRGLLADIYAGRVIDDADFRPHLHLDGEPPADVATAVWAAYRLGWAQQVTLDGRWRLTLLGVNVLEGRAP